MIVDLTKLENSQIEFELSIKPDEIEFDNEFVSAKEDVKFDGKLSNQAAWALIEGEISTKLDIACGRCLESVKTPVNFEFEAAFINAKRLTDDVDMELEAEGLDVSILVGHKIDLVDVAQERVMLSIPSQTLCKQDCKGLCPECGANKNSKACNCDEKAIDSRWSALSEIKHKKD